MGTRFRGGDPTAGGAPAGATATKYPTIASFSRSIVAETLPVAPAVACVVEAIPEYVDDPPSVLGTEDDPYRAVQPDTIGSVQYGA